MNYKLNERWTIEWMGEGENFCVNEYFFDFDVGHVDNPEIYSSNFFQCLNFVLKQEGL